METPVRRGPRGGETPRPAGPTRRGDSPSCGAHEAGRLSSCGAHEAGRLPVLRGPRGGETPRPAGPTRRGDSPSCGAHEAIRVNFSLKFTTICANPRTTTRYLSSEMGQFQRWSIAKIVKYKTGPHCSMFIYALRLWLDPREAATLHCVGSTVHMCEHSTILRAHFHYTYCSCLVSSVQGCSWARQSGL